MNFFKSIVAFIIGLVLLLLFYYYVSIPLIPAIAIYASATLFLDNRNKNGIRIFFVLILSLIGLAIYGANTYLTIVNYPDFGNIFSIIFGVVNVLAIFGAGVANIFGLRFDKA